MDDLQLEGSKLKSLVKLGKKRPLSFAFCAGDKDDHTFLIHKKFEPKKLGQKAREISGSKKAAFGTFELNGLVMEMTCDRVVPKMAKSLKKYLKKQKIGVNVVILDMDGNPLDSDIEELPHDPTMDDDSAAQPETTAAPASTQEPPQADGKDSDAPAGLDAAGLVARIKNLQPALAAAEDAAAAKLKKVAAMAVSQIKSAALEQADKTITALEGALAKLDTGPASQPDPAASSEPDPTATESAPDLKSLATRASALKGVIGDMTGPAKDKLIAALGKAVSEIKAQNLAAADTLLGRIEAAAAKVAASAPQATAAVAIEQNRQTWVQTRLGMRSEIEKLKAAIDKATEGIEGLEDVPSKSDALFDYLDGIDTELEDVLQDLANSDDADGREALKAKANEKIKAYQETLDSDFFKAVDNNGFIQTDVRGSALATLKSVSSALAA